ARGGGPGASRRAALGPLPRGRRLRPGLIPRRRRTARSARLVLGADVVDLPAPAVLGERVGDAHEHVPLRADEERRELDGVDAAVRAVAQRLALAQQLRPVLAVGRDLDDELVREL